MTTNQLIRTSPAALVRRNFELVDREGLAAVRPSWRDDAVWHVTGDSAWAGDLAVDDYFAMLEPVVAEATYRFEVVGLLEVGELVIVEIASEGSIGGIEVMPDGGLMIYRVVDGMITEGWAIAAGSGGSGLF